VVQKAKRLDCRRVGFNYVVRRVFYRAGFRETAGVVFLYTSLKMEPRDSINLYLWKGYKDNGLGVLLG
jgi:hypothetical protein